MVKARRDLVESLSDSELLSAMKHGGRGALAELYSRHAPKLLALARATVGDPAEAEDLIHDVFLEAWKQAESYDPARGSVKIWLSVRARSRALDRIRSRRRRSDVLDAEGADQQALTHAYTDPPVDPIARGSLFAALSEMQESQREVLALGYFDDLSATEIAERLQLPVGTVKSRTRAALAALRGMLGSKA